MASNYRDQKGFQPFETDSSSESGTSSETSSQDDKELARMLEKAPLKVEDDPASSDDEDSILDLDTQDLDRLQNLLILTTMAKPKTNDEKLVLDKIHRQVIGKLRKFQGEGTQFEGLVPSNVEKVDRAKMNKILLSRENVDTHNKSGTGRLRNRPNDLLQMEDDIWSMPDDQDHVYRVKYPQVKIPKPKAVADLEDKLTELLNDLTLRESLLRAKIGKGPKANLWDDVNDIRRHIEQVTMQLQEAKQIVGLKQKQFQIPPDFPASGVDLYKLKKLAVEQSNNIERMLENVIELAQIHRLSHDETKRLLAHVLPEKAYKTYQACRDDSLAEIIQLISEQFCEPPGAVFKLNQIDKFSFKKGESIKSGLARLKGLLKETDHLVPQVERAGRKNQIQTSKLNEALPPQIREKLEFARLKAVREGSVYTLDQMINEAEDLLTSSNTKLVIKNQEGNSPSSSNVEVNNMDNPKKRKLDNGKNSNSGKRKYFTYVDNDGKVIKVRQDKANKQNFSKKAQPSQQPQQGQQPQQHQQGQQSNQGNRKNSNYQQNKNSQGYGNKFNNKGKQGNYNNNNNKGYNNQNRQFNNKNHNGKHQMHFHNGDGRTVQYGWNDHSGYNYLTSLPPQHVQQPRYFYPNSTSHNSTPRYLQNYQVDLQPTPPVPFQQAALPPPNDSPLVPNSQQSN